MTAAAGTVVSPSQGPSAGDRARDWGPPVLLLVGLLVTWELLVRVLDIKQFILPGPVAIAVAWQTYLPELFAAARYTFVEIVAGLVIGATAGIVVGAITARYRSMQDSLMPFAVAASSVPILAFAPLFNNWFGLDQQLSKAMVAAALCFFPVMINTVRGLTTVDPQSLELMRSYAAPEIGRVPQAARPQRAAVHLHRAPAGGDPGDDRCGGRRVLRGAAREPRPVHRDVLGVPQLRAVVGGDRVRVRDRDRAVPRRRGRGTDRHALARPAARRGVGTGRVSALRRRARPTLGRDRRSLDCIARRRTGSRSRSEPQRCPMRSTRALALFTVALMAVAACSGGGGSAAPAELKPIRLQLQWFPQAQFAGYFAALDKGYYREEGFDVTILPGAVEIVPATVVAGGQAEFGISWVPRMLAPRESGADGVVIAQIFQRSPTLQVSFKDKNITKPEDLAGKKVGAWGFGNEAELYAGLRKAGLDPDEPQRRLDRRPAVRHGRVRRR